MSPRVMSPETAVIAANRLPFSTVTRTVSSLRSLLTLINKSVSKWISWHKKKEVIIQPRTLLNPRDALLSSLCPIIVRYERSMTPWKCLKMFFLKNKRTLKPENVSYNMHGVDLGLSRPICRNVLHKVCFWFDLLISMILLFIRNCQI